MMNCQQATRMLSDAQERELSLKDWVALKIHVMRCSGCRNFGKQMGLLRDISHSYAKGLDNTKVSENEADAGTSKRSDDEQHE